jgi:hypothetical protein
MKHLTILLFLISTAATHAGVVTLTTEQTETTNGVAEITVGSYEVAELLSLHGNRCYLEVVRDAKTIPCEPNKPVVVAGPATIRLTAYYTLGTPKGLGFCTFRISPEAFPPDRTILLPPGTNQARIALECSTNLVHWSAATNGVYGPLPEAKFFRIKLEPLQ